MNRNTARAAALFVTLLVLGVMAVYFTVAALAAPTPAVAAARGPICNYTSVCGVYRVGGSVAIGAIPNWGPDSQNGYGGGWYKAVVQPGHRSSEFYQDTDGYYIGRGYCADVYILARGYWSKVRTVGYGNHKISDIASQRLVAYRC